MWVVWIVSALSIGLVAVSVLLLRDDWRTAQGGWKLLAGSGIPLALGGLGFILRFWEPLPGPFRANDLYPLGPYLNAWAVSFGFMWMAFGLAFYASALRAPAAGKTCLILFATWVLAWIPHGIIGIGFAVAGENAESVQLYQDWAAEWLGLAILAASALVLLSHFILGLIGFAVTGRSLWHQRIPSVNSAPDG